MKKLLFVFSIALMSLVACVGGTQDSSSECTTETKKECCSSDEGKKECSSSESESTHSHDHAEGESHEHNNADGEENAHEH